MQGHIDQLRIRRAELQDASTALGKESRRASFAADQLKGTIEQLEDTPGVLAGLFSRAQLELRGKTQQSSDLNELNYARLAEGFGCQGIRVEDPDALGAALTAGMRELSRPTVIDIVVTRDPAQMLPGVDNRAAPARKGDRIA